MAGWNPARARAACETRTSPRPPPPSVVPCLRRCTLAVPHPAPLTPPAAVPTPDRLRRRVLTPLRIALIYAVVSALWILLSDRAVAAMGLGPAATTELQTLKGWGFVAATALLLYALIARAQVALRREQGLAAAVLACIPEGVLVSDAEERFLYANPAAAAMAGRTPAQLLGRTAADVLPPEHARVVAAVDARLLAGGAPELVELVDGEGDTRRILRSTMAAVRDEVGEVSAVVSITRDVSEVRRAEALLRAREATLRQGEKMEAIGRLAGGVAHDVNNVLTIIAGATELALEGLASITTTSDRARAEVRHDLEEVRSATMRAADLTRRLLAFTRHRATAVERVPLDASVADLVSLVRRTLPAGVEVGLNTGDAAIAVRAEPSALSQIVLNLVLNAADALPAGGVVMVSTGAITVREGAAPPEGTALGPGQYGLLRVTDDGVGMDEATRARATEPFFTTKSQGKGTGLGLATADAVARQHGGALTIVSAPGRGTTVSVYLPRADAEGAPEPEVASRATRDGDAGEASRLVLLAEDEGAVRAVARRALEHAGYRVLEARHGADAIRMVEDSGVLVDLLVTDVMMPEVGGVALAERLRARRPALPVLFVSGYTGGVLPGTDGPADAPTDYLAKPFTPEELTRAAAALLARA